MNASGQVALQLSDGTNTYAWSTDEECPVASAGHADGARHDMVTVDGLSRYVGFVVDGVLNDGGASRHQGWGALSPYVHDLGGNGGSVTCNVSAAVGSVRVYDRYLRTSECIGNWRSTTM